MVLNSITPSGASASALGPDFSLLYAPHDRRYEVKVTFDAATPDARVSALHYVFYRIRRPASFRASGIGYGAESPGGGDPAMHVWDVPSCGVRIRYRVQLSEGKTPLLEELLDRPAPGERDEGTGAGRSLNRGTSAREPTDRMR